VLHKGLMARWQFLQPDIGLDEILDQLQPFIADDPRDEHLWFCHG
jgi:hypothetical protein